VIAVLCQGKSCRPAQCPHHVPRTGQIVADCLPAVEICLCPCLGHRAFQQQRRCCTLQGVALQSCKGPTGCCNELVYSSRVSCNVTSTAQSEPNYIPVYGGSASFPLSRTTVIWALLSQSPLPPYLHHDLHQTQLYVLSLLSGISCCSLALEACCAECPSEQLLTHLGHLMRRGIRLLYNCRQGV